MITIEYKAKSGKTGSKKVHDFALENELAAFRRFGYVILSPVAKVVEVSPVVPVEEIGTTGTVGKGKKVHRIVVGHAVCGASYRRNSLGNSARQVRITGQAVTCGNCA